MFPSFLENIFTKRKKIIVILGQTATGKTSLAIEVAQKINGEIISADSRQVYTGLDIGSAKVTVEEMKGISHYMIDVANPRDSYSVQEYAQQSTCIIDDIHRRKKVPIVCGGTGMYIDALIYQQEFPKVAPNYRLREQLEKLSVSELYGQLERENPKRALSIDKHNKVRLVRALEIIHGDGSLAALSMKSPYKVLFIGLHLPQEILHHRIHHRIIDRFENGMLQEAQHLLDQGVAHERLEALGLEYRYMSRYLRGDISYHEMISELDAATRKFAKRQRTWFQRNKKIKWFDSNNKKEIYDLIKTFIKK